VPGILLKGHFADRPRQERGTDALAEVTKTALAEAQVLDEYRVGFNLAVATVDDLDVP
jgi:hypothetical protein